MITCCFIDAFIRLLTRILVQPLICIASKQCSLTACRSVSGLFAGTEGRGGEVTIEVKLATNQLPIIFVCIVSVAYLFRGKLYMGQADVR